MNPASPTGVARTLAESLDRAWRTRTPIAPISETHPETDVAAAYAIQSLWSEIRVGRGDTIVGRKVGLTNPAIQQQLGVSEPDYGALWASSRYAAVGGRVEIPVSDFLQPRIEGEVAFLIRDELTGGDVTARDILAATEACALGVEIVDSRVADWRIKLVDTIADNASYGGFSVGPWDGAMVSQDLGELIMQVRVNGDVVAEGVGHAVLGNPANSAAWLVNKLHALGVGLKPGDVVISGAITKMLPVKTGDEIVLSLSGQPELKVVFG